MLSAERHLATCVHLETTKCKITKTSQLYRPFRIKQGLLFQRRSIADTGFVSLVDTTSCMGVRMNVSSTHESFIHVSK